MSKKQQDKGEKIYEDIAKIIAEFEEYKKSEFAKRDELTHELIVAIIEACKEND